MFIHILIVGATHPREKICSSLGPHTRSSLHLSISVDLAQQQNQRTTLDIEEKTEGKR